jgi:hypothetical protein
LGLGLIAGLVVAYRTWHGGGLAPYLRVTGEELGFDLDDQKGPT